MWFVVAFGVVLGFALQSSKAAASPTSAPPATGPAIAGAAKRDKNSAPKQVYTKVRTISRELEFTSGSGDDKSCVKLREFEEVKSIAGSVLVDGRSYVYVMAVCAMI